MKISISLQYPFGSQSYEQFLRAFRILGIPTQDEIISTGSDGCEIFVGRNLEAFTSLFSSPLFQNLEEIIEEDPDQYWNAPVEQDDIIHFSFDWKEALPSYHEEKIKKLEGWGIQIQQGELPNQWFVSRNDDYRPLYASGSSFQKTKDFIHFFKELLIVLVLLEENPEYKKFKKAHKRQLDQQNQFINLIEERASGAIVIDEELLSLRALAKANPSSAWGKIYSFIQKTREADPEIILHRMLHILRTDRNKEELCLKLLEGVYYQKDSFEVSKGILKLQFGSAVTHNISAKKLTNSIILVLLGQLSPSQRTRFLNIEMAPCKKLHLEGLAFVPPEIGSFKGLESLTLRKEDYSFLPIV